MGITIVLLGGVIWGAGCAMMSGLRWLSPEESDDATGTNATGQAGSIVMTFAAGMVTAMLLWMLSGALLKSMTAGTIALALTGIGGLTRWRQRGVWSILAAKAMGPAGWVVTAAMTLGILHYGVQGVKLGEALYFRGYIGDLAHYAYLGALIRESGLPLINLTGSDGGVYQPLQHLGLPILLAGFGDIGRSDPYLGIRLLGIWGYPLIALTGWTLANSASPRLRPLAALSPLIFGGLFLLTEIPRGNWLGVFNPYMRAIVQPGSASGSLYHSITQLWSVVFAGAALLAWSEGRRRERFRHLAFIFLTGSMLTKPSLVIFLLPAFAIGLAFSRTHGKEWRRLLFYLSGMLLLYLWPVGLAGVPIGGSHSHWRVGIHPRNPPMFFLLFAGLGGAVWALIGSRWWRLLKSGASELDQSRAIVTIALLGAALFAALGYEPDTKHLNEYWGLCGMIVLAAPFLFQPLGKASDQDITGYLSYRGGNLILSLLLMLHLSSGLLHAAASAAYYPQANRIALSLVREVKTIERSTLQGARFLIDPDYDGRRMDRVRPFLPRPILQENFVSPEQSAVYASFAGWIESPDASFPSALDRADRLIFHSRRDEAISILKASGWRKETILARGFELWARDRLP
ncbi:MAG: hypothetical protein FJY67_02940 [Calditrichaeota bacterium]|nr:hypothetical protein [Calditrichota bacterium]